MLLLPCPWCGDREESEFTYGGDATAPWPDLEAGREQWFDAIYLRDNPKGWHDELWHHAAGCRRYLKVRRNTVTHEIAGAAAPGEDIPGDGS